ncbi:MAG: RidA family protein [Planctomycetaceae bacterium]
MTSRIEQKLESLGLALPAAPPAVGAYVPVLRTGTLVVTSGQLPFVDQQLVSPGKLGDNVSDEDGYHAARICALNALAQIKSCCGDLDRVRQIVRLEGHVHSAPGFQNQPFVLNGASELMSDVFGETGRHTRTALGINEMPLNACVQLSVWAEVESEND